MIKKLMVSAGLCLALASPALSGAADALIGNTVVTTIDGADTQWIFNADGTFKSTAPNGQAGSGAWTLTGDQLCVMPTGGDKLCTQVPAGKAAGDSWQTTNNQGQSFQMSIIAGRKS
jgi:hypothetical protein